ncbi:MAG: hypothetical protein ACJ71D_07680 [Nitrososphaera sp.]
MEDGAESPPGHKRPHRRLSIQKGFVFLNNSHTQGKDVSHERESLHSEQKDHHDSQYQQQHNHHHTSLSTEPEITTTSSFVMTS